MPMPALSPRAPCPWHPWARWFCLSGFILAWLQSRSIPGRQDLSLLAGPSPAHTMPTLALGACPHPGSPQTRRHTLQRSPAQGGLPRGAMSFLSLSSASCGG